MESGLSLLSLCTLFGLMLPRNVGFYLVYLGVSLSAVPPCPLRQACSERGLNTVDWRCIHATSLLFPLRSIVFLVQNVEWLYSVFRSSNIVTLHIQLTESSARSTASKDAIMKDDDLTLQSFRR